MVAEVSQYLVGGVSAVVTGLGRGVGSAPMSNLGAAAKRFALATVVCAVVLVAAGAVFAAATGDQTQPSVAAALFIGAAVLIVFNALGQSTVRDRGVDVRTGMTYPGAGSFDQGSLGWALIGVVLIGFGVLTLVV